MMDKKTLNIQKNIKDDIAIIKLSGNLNAYTAPEFESILKGTIEENPKIILNLSELDYISSIGLGVIIGYIEDARERGGDIKIHLKNNPVIKEIFEITGFPKIIKFYEDENSCMESYKSDVT